MLHPAQPLSTCNCDIMLHQSKPFVDLLLWYDVTSYVASVDLQLWYHITLGVTLVDLQLLYHGMSSIALVDLLLCYHVT